MRKAPGAALPVPVAATWRARNVRLCGNRRHHRTSASVQSEQSRLTRILLDRLQREPLFDIRFDSKVADVTQDRSRSRSRWSATDSARRGGALADRADGARSEVRRALDITFDASLGRNVSGHQHAVRFLRVIADLVSVTYVADRSAGTSCCRSRPVALMFRWRRRRATSCTRSRLCPSAAGTVCPASRTMRSPHDPLQGHQRVAKTFRRGRAFLVGDAAHINNPLAVWHERRHP